MKAVIINKFGDLEGSIVKTDLDIPRPLEKEVLIKVKAAGVNRPDILQRQGLYKVPNDASPIMGLEVSGEIIETGTAVTKKNIGDRVCALVPGGGYAEYVVTNEAHCLPIPKGLSMEAAAGLCECLFTVWINMVKLGQLKENERFLEARLLKLNCDKALALLHWMPTLGIHETIKFIIRQDGTVIEEVIGVESGNCINLTESIEEALGSVVTREYKPEYYNNVTLQHNQNQDQTQATTD